MYKQNLYKKYNKIKEMLREIYYNNTNGTVNNLLYPTPTSSPLLPYSIPFYNTYKKNDSDSDDEIVFKPVSKIINSANNQYINNNKILVEIIILSYLFSSTLILGFIKHMFK